MGLDGKVIDWLLEDENPSVKFRTMRDLLGYNFNADEIAVLGDKILKSKQTRKIFSKMHPDGYWLHNGCGDEIDYAMSSSTHFVLSYLAELGLSRTNADIDKAVIRYISLEKTCKWLTPPDYATHQSCLYAYNIRTFAMLGYKNEDWLKKRVDVLLSDIRHDDGYLCIRSSYNEKTKSCIRGTLKALMAYAEFPELWKHESCQKTVNYFLKRNVYFQTANPQVKIHGGMRTIFPFVIGESLLEPLYALSKMGYANHPALKDAWESLENRRDGDGRYLLDRSAATLFNPGKPFEANKWVTFYALMALKHKT